MGAAKAVSLARIMSTWMWPVALSAVLATIVVIAQFRDRRTSHYPVVLFTFYFGITRLLVLRHVMLLRTVWSPDLWVLLLWVAYYIVYVGLIASFALRVRALWKVNGWFSRVIQLVAGLLLVYHGFLTVFRPYSILLRR